MGNTISVIIPHKNDSEMITRALSSVQLQGLSGLQIVIVDDNSNLEQKLQLKESVDKFPKLNITLKDSYGVGLAAARNTGIKFSHNKYLAFLDCDDQWLENKLMLQVKAFEKNIVAVHGWCINTNFNKHEVLLKPRIQFARKALLNGSYSVTGSASCMMVRREIALKVGGFNENLQFGEDLDMWARITQFGEIKCLPIPLVRIAIREGSMQSNLRSDPKVKASAHAIMTNNWKRLGLINSIQNNFILANRVLSIASEYSRGNSIFSVLSFLFKPFNDKYPKFSFNLFLFLALLSRISLKRASNDK
jgi:glycosyltransferase involved in cell wall biosynthesis